MKYSLVPLLLAASLQAAEMQLFNGKDLAAGGMPRHEGAPADQSLASSCRTDCW